MTCRLLMIGLDGFEPTLADQLIAEGRLPTLKAIRDRAATASLDHGEARRTGLAWEHVATGLAPDDAKRWAAVDFDPLTYRAWQRPTRLAPFPARLRSRTVVFDAPYFDLEAAPDVEGLVAWGAHDPGVRPACRPEGLGEELERRFGTYPATGYIYGFAWPNAEQTKHMGEALARAVDIRFEAARWLFGERCPDWQLGLMVVSEFHSGAEALWHGVHPKHPLAAHPSAKPAREALEAVYERTDRCLAKLLDDLADTRLVLFNMHGMGPNDSDPASMILLAELMYRHSFGTSRLKQGHFASNDLGVPLLEQDQGWEASISSLLPISDAGRRLIAKVIRRLGLNNEGEDRIPLSWMPGARYARFWPNMQAFALPSFYDGRIRINLRGREREGKVALSDYDRLCSDLEALLLECRDPRTGKLAVDRVERTEGDPLDLSTTEADLIVIWRDAPLGLEHPALGRIGPIPYRRTGGHTGGDGFAWFSGTGLVAGDHGRRSAFDLVPTVIDLLGADPTGFSGLSFAAEILAPSRSLADA